MKNLKQTQMKQNQAGAISKAEQIELQQQYDITVMSQKIIQDFNRKFNRISKEEKKIYEKYSEMHFEDVVVIAAYHTMYRMITKYAKEETGGLQEMLIREMENKGVLIKCGEHKELDLQELIMEAKIRYQKEKEKSTDMKRK